MNYQGTDIRPISRIEYIDIMRGLGIIAVVAGHCNLAVKFVYLFHIPLFMFICGMLNHHDSAQTAGELIKRIRHDIWKRYVPFVTVEIIFLAFHNIFYSLHWLPNEYNGSDYINMLIRIVTMGGGESLAGALWFVIVLFEVTVGFEFLLLLKKFFPEKFSIILLIIGIISLFIGYNFQMPRLLDRSALLLFYYIAGYLFSRHLTVWVEWSKKIPVLAMFLAILIFASFYPVSYCSGNIIFSVFCACSGIMFSLGLSNLLSRCQIVKQLLKRYGNCSFYIMAYHFAGAKIVLSILALLKIVSITDFNTLLPPANTPLWLCILLCLAGLEISCIICYFWKKVYGKFRNILPQW